MENFDLRNFLIENKLTTNSKLLSEQEIDEIDVRKLGRNFAAGAAMLAGTLGAQGQEAPKPTDSIKPLTQRELNIQKREEAKKKREIHMSQVNAKLKARIDNWIAANPGSNEKDYWNWQKDRQKGPDAQPDGLEVGKACKRGKDKGSCVSGQTYRGDSLKDND
jgi:hypothetical protein